MEDDPSISHPDLLENQLVVSTKDDADDPLAKAADALGDFVFSYF
jgi:hypothetical protein